MDSPLCLSFVIDNLDNNIKKLKELFTDYYITINNLIINITNCLIDNNKKIINSNCVITIFNDYLKTKKNLGDLEILFTNNYNKITILQNKIKEIINDTLNFMKNIYNSKIINFTNNDYIIINSKLQIFKNLGELVFIINMIISNKLIFIIIRNILNINQDNINKFITTTFYIICKTSFVSIDKTLPINYIYNMIIIFNTIYLSLINAKSNYEKQTEEINYLDLLNGKYQNINFIGKRKIITELENKETKKSRFYTDDETKVGEILISLNNN